MLRYKMTCEYTWPNHLMSSDQEAVEAIVNQHGFEDDVAYGHTKLFVRTPRTLFTLEQERAALIPILVLFLQKVTDTLFSLLPLSLSVSWGALGLFLSTLFIVVPETVPLLLPVFLLLLFLALCSCLT